MSRFATIVFCWIAATATVPADTLPRPPADVGVIGQVKYTAADRNETLLDVARRHDVGQNEILLANPSVDRWLPEDRAHVVLPKRYVLPKAERSGLILNLPEMRLYYFPGPKAGETPVVITHPVSVGRMDWKTPLGRTSIVSKQRDPAWRPPKSLKAEAAAEGETLPDVVPPGPDNPLGRYALRLGIPGYLIHSTNKPYGVGMRVTHGCIRMYPEDIARVFDDIPVGTPVQIVNQPIKLGWLAGALFMELHPPLDEDREEYSDYMQKVLDSIAEFLTDTQGMPDGARNRRINLSGKALRQAVAEMSGMPVMISKPAAD